MSAFSRFLTLTMSIDDFARDDETETVPGWLFSDGESEPMPSSLHEGDSDDGMSAETLPYQSMVPIAAEDADTQPYPQSPNRRRWADMQDTDDEGDESPAWQRQRLSDENPNFHVAVVHLDGQRTTVACSHCDTVRYVRMGVSAYTNTGMADFVLSLDSRMLTDSQTMTELMAVEGTVFTVVMKARPVLHRVGCAT